MRYVSLARSIALLACGAGLFYVAVVFLGGILAAVAIPKEYFALFDRKHVSLALALMFSITWALPVAAVVASGVFLSLRAIGTRVLPSAVFVFVGMAGCFLYWQFASASFLVESSGPGFSLLQGLALSFTVPWFSIPNLLAPWLGFAAGVWLMARLRGREAYRAGA